MTLLFLAVVLAVPFGDALSQWLRKHERPQIFGIARLPPGRAELRDVVGADGLRAGFEAISRINRGMLVDILRFESDLKTASVVANAIVPLTQALITGVLRGGTEDAYVGRGNWLFYRPDVDYVMGRGFLDERVLSRRAAAGDELTAPPRPDPTPAIIDFRDQLAARGIELLVVPIPVKPSIHPERFSFRYSGGGQPVQNHSYLDFLERLTAAGVHVLDIASFLGNVASTPGASPLYLRSDTHWTPAAMEQAAGIIAGAARDIVEFTDVFRAEAGVIENSVSNTGDIAAMLKLPAGHGLMLPETVTIRQVLTGDGFWRPDPMADILFLGDSFANIYSVKALGWGESAGLAEHISLHLERPLDALRRNDAGAWATRDMLARELARGNDRLAGKRVVVWQFAARELAAGDWKMIPLTLGTPSPAGFFSPRSGQTVAVSGLIQSVTAAPRPGRAAYPDHIIAIHLTGLQGKGVPDDAQAVVYTWSMKNHEWTAAARWLPGQEVELILRDWLEVESRLGAINRAELEDDSLMFEPVCWGEEIR